FYTGQASNPLAAGFAQSVAKVDVTWASWLVAGIVPRAVSIPLVPWMGFPNRPPQILHTPPAPRVSPQGLVAMGPLDRTQKIVLGIFVTTCALWLTSQFHRLGISEVALLGACGLFLSGVLTWEDAVSEKAAWDVFIWYGGLVRLGEALNEFG